MIGGVDRRGIPLLDGEITSGVVGVNYWTSRPSQKDFLGAARGMTLLWFYYILHLHKVHGVIRPMRLEVLLAIRFIFNQSLEVLI